jgi:hypothetical protein
MFLLFDKALDLGRNIAPKKPSRTQKKDLASSPGFVFEVRAPRSGAGLAQSFGPDPMP